jgi:hypothetical protein
VNYFRGSGIDDTIPEIEIWPGSVRQWVGAFFLGPCGRPPWMLRLPTIMIARPMFHDFLARRKMLMTAKPMPTTLRPVSGSCKKQSPELPHPR